MAETQSSAASGSARPRREPGIPLAVPFAEKDKAKSFGAFWDLAQKVWCAPKGADLSNFEKWIPKQPALQSSRDARSEISDMLRLAGLDEPSPVLDGKWQRGRDEDGKRGNKDVSYRGTLDGGFPRCYVENHRTGFKQSWFPEKDQAHKTMPIEQARALRAQAEMARAEREAQDKKERDQRAAAQNAKWQRLADVSEGSNEYLNRKGVGVYDVKSDGPNLVVCMRNAEGAIRSLQTIEPDGTKKFAWGCDKKGCFSFCGKPEDGKPILVAEGYATAASIYESTGIPCACAFDAGNIESVSQALRKLYPDSALCICADNDLWNPANPGLARATAAAEACGAALVHPKFSAIPDGQKPTDFNDLMLLEGKSAVARQVGAALARTRSNEQPLYTPLQTAILAGDIGAVKDLLSQGENPREAQDNAFAKKATELVAPEKLRPIVETLLESMLPHPSLRSASAPTHAAPAPARAQAQLAR